ncbi:hypothetical protein A2U01_0072078, partial [Trifolium medium]|nr:hypothetical protein [Trifolium medium]
MANLRRGTCGAP